MKWDKFSVSLLDAEYSCVNVAVCRWPASGCLLTVGERKALAMPSLKIDSLCLMLLALVMPWVYTIAVWYWMLL